MGYLTSAPNKFHNTGLKLTTKLSGGNPAPPGNFAYCPVEISGSGLAARELKQGARMETRLVFVAIYSVLGWEY
jgi:hypothetical protein